MNTYAPGPHLKSKTPLVFRVALQLVSIRLRSPKPISVSFEFTNAKTVVNSRDYHKVEANAYETLLRETVDMPLVVVYDLRKGRFLAQAVEFSVLSNHSGFSKKMASGSVNVSQILNNQALISREQVKLEKCFDKAAVLNLKAAIEFKGVHCAMEAEALNFTKSSVSTIRWYKQLRSAGGHFRHEL